MARIINLEFHLFDKPQNALVSLGGDEKHPFVHVELTDSFYQGFFGIQHVRYKGFDGYKALGFYKKDVFLRRLFDALAQELERELSRNYAKVRNLFHHMKMQQS
jgi:hypothetical protein